MNIRVAAILSVLSLLAGTYAPAVADDWQVTFPAPLSSATWLGTHRRLCFGIDGKSLDEAIKDGTNVICGGTNAAGIGFAGGPFILGKHGEIVDILSGVPIPEQTLAELRTGRCSSRAGREGLGRSHPVQHDAVAASGASGVAGHQLARRQTDLGRAIENEPRARLLEFALRRLVHQVAGRTREAARLGWLQYGWLRLLVAVFLSVLHRGLPRIAGVRFPRPET